MDRLRAVAGERGGRQPRPGAEHSLPG